MPLCLLTRAGGICNMASYKRLFFAVIIVLLLVPVIYSSTQIKSGSSLCALPDVPLKFSGIWHTVGNPGNYIYYGMDMQQLNSKIDKLSKEGYAMIEIEPYVSNGKDWFAGLWLYREQNAHHVVYGVSLRQLEDYIQQFKKDGFYMTDIEPYIDSSGNTLWAAIWDNNGRPKTITYEKDLQTFMKIADDNKKAGLFIKDIDTYVDKSGKRLWAGVWEGRKSSNPVEARTQIFYQMSPQEVEKKISSLAKTGWLAIDLDTYDVQGNRLWAGAWTFFKSPGHAIPDMDEAQFNTNLKSHGKTDILLDLDIYEPRSAGEVGDIPCNDNPGKGVQD